MKDFEVDLELFGTTITVTGKFSKGRKAPDVRDHDAPGFSDPGDPIEIGDYEIRTDEDITNILSSEVLSTITEMLEGILQEE